MPPASSVASSLQALWIEPLAIAPPGARKILLRFLRFGGHALTLEARLQAVERPCVVRRAREALAERIARRLGIAFQQVHGAERLPNRVVPVRRLHVRQ